MCKWYPSDHTNYGRPYARDPRSAEVQGGGIYN